jgi:hypothetical protein
LIVFRPEGDRYVAQIELNVLCGDKDQKVIGTWRQTMTLRLRAEVYERLRKEQVTVVVRMPLKSDPVYVKAVVYEYDSDTLGTASLYVKGL